MYIQKQIISPCDRNTPYQYGTSQQRVFLRSEYSVLVRYLEESTLSTVLILSIRIGVFIPMLLGEASIFEVHTSTVQEVYRWYYSTNNTSQLPKSPGTVQYITVVLRYGVGRYQQLLASYQLLHVARVVLQYCRYSEQLLASTLYYCTYFSYLPVLLLQQYYQ